MGTTSFGLPTSGSGTTNAGNFLGDTLQFETFHGGNILKKIGQNPSRLITGVDPASTGLWNTVLGTHNKPIVDQMGGATGDDYAKASNAGINATPGHDMQDLAHVVAAAFAAEGLAGAAGMGGGASSSAADPALAGDNIDAGGGWNPASGGSSGGASSSTLSPQQAQMIGNALQNLGKQQQQRGLAPIQTQQQWQPGVGGQIVTPTN